MFRSENARSKTRWKMATKIVLIAISSIILLGSAFDMVGDPEVRQEILESTFMITVIVPELEPAPEVDEALPIPPDEYRAIAKPDSYIVSDGLGSLLLDPDGQLLIITHDHWTSIDSDLGLVRISNGYGQIITEMQLFQFKRLIRHRDGGTMVLSAPDKIANSLDLEQLESQSRSLGKHHVVAGDEVSLVYRQREGQSGVAVMRVEVESIGLKQGLPVLRLSTPEDMPVIAGDSGGGIWLDGELVANTWTTLMIINGQTGETRSANSSIAALASDAWAG
jgi:hypothetical protein